MVLGPPSRFNIRVYGILIEHGRLLLNEEKIGDRQVVKFPGGGLELGEGTKEGLQREWMEELGWSITVQEHFYTTDFFQPSAFDRSQVISIYYRVACPEAAGIIQNRNAAEHTFWLELSRVNADIFTLPIDKVVGDMLARRFGTHAS